MSGGTLPAKAWRADASSTNGPCSTSFSSSSAVERMISLARFTSVHAGQLHQDLVVAAVPRDDRLGHAQLVDAPLDRLQRLVHRLLRAAG